MPPAAKYISVQIFDLPDIGLGGGAPSGVVGVDGDGESGDFRNVAQLEIVLDRIAEVELGDDLLADLDDLGADIAPARLEVAPRIGMVGAAGIAEKQADEIRAVRHQHRSARYLI